MLSNNNNEMETCTFCAKTYKSKLWLAKHINACHPSQAAEQPSQAAEQPSQAAEQPSQAADPSNIRTEQFIGSPFHYTIKAKSKCMNYISPLSNALNDVSEHKQIVICREKPGKAKNADDKPKAFKSYGCVSFDQLNSVWQTNLHLYEVIKNEHKPYFDIEFKPIDKEDQYKIRTAILDLIKTSFEKVNVPYSIINDSAICQNIGKGESGIFAGLSKASYHLIINNGYKFISHDDSNKFAKYLEQRMRTEPKYSCLITAEGPAIDLKVYNKNRCFKLPNQSKAGSTRIQNVNTKFNRQSLNDFLISHNTDNLKPIDVSSITLIFDGSKKSAIGAAKAEFHGNKWNWNAIEEFKNSLVNTDHTTNIDGAPNYDIKYLVDSIYNGPQVSYKSWFKVGSAIKRSVLDYNEAINLFLAWTQKYDKYATLESIRTAFDGFSDQSCGFKTLLSLARLCNAKLDNYADKLHNQLFSCDKMPTEITNITVNKRYLDFADIIPTFKQNGQMTLDMIKPKTNDNVPETSNTFFIKSPMGTGKTYNLINYIKQRESKNDKLTVIYLSSRRAFAESTAADFQEVGLANYMKCDISQCNRVIISLESLNRLSPAQINTNGILIIDESESIFSAFSSSTMINSDYVDKITILKTLIERSKIVFCMDAFLSNRSIEAVQACRPITKFNTVMYVNNYKYDERQYLNFPTKDSMLNDIKAKLLAGKRVCVVSGSSMYGQRIIDNTRDIPNITSKFYNASNPLNLSINVNSEWSDCQLLIYSPTITCGISYTAAEKFDNLYIYAVNKGSCHFRDIIQASRRIRSFTDPVVGVCLNTKFKGFNPDQYPVYNAEIKAIYSQYRLELYPQATSILSMDAINWMYNIHCFNIMERNIHSIYMEDVAKAFFDIENIKPMLVGNTDFDLTCPAIDTSPENWLAAAIPDINHEEYIDLTRIVRFKQATSDEIKQWTKYSFAMEFGRSEIFNALFDTCYSSINRQYMPNILRFRNMLRNGDIIHGTDIIELTDKRDFAMRHLMKIMVNLGLIEKNETTHEYKLNIDKEINTIDFERVSTEYKLMNPKAINQLFTDQYLKTNNKAGEHIEFSSRTMRAIFDKLLKDNFGYTTKTNGSVIRSINGAKRKITNYSLGFINGIGCILSSF